MSKFRLKDAKSIVLQNTIIDSIDGIPPGEEGNLIIKSISFEYDLSDQEGPVFLVEAEFKTIEEAVEAYNAIKSVSL